jgi:hypothetical protein
MGDDAHPAAGGKLTQPGLQKAQRLLHQCIDMLLLLPLPLLLLLGLLELGAPADVCRRSMLLLLLLVGRSCQYLNQADQLISSCHWQQAHSCLQHTVISRHPTP